MWIYIACSHEKVIAVRPKAYHPLLCTKESDCIGDIVQEKLQSKPSEEPSYPSKDAERKKGLTVPMGAHRGS
jgi:hypothetical protein